MALRGWLGRAVMRDPRTVVHMPNLIKLYWRLFRDPRVSWVAKLVIVAGVVYVIVPLDLIPDWPVPFVGYLDDALILALTAKGFIRLCPPNVVREHVMLIDQGG